LLNLLQSYKICFQDSIGYKPQEHKKFCLGKNLSLYSPIDVWLTMALVALVQRELEWLKCCNHRLPLIFDGLRGLKSLSRILRKFLSLRSNVWKDIFHWDKMSLKLCFLLKSQNDLHEKLVNKLKLLESLSTAECNGQFLLLMQSQNSMWLLMSLLRNSLNSWEIVAEYIW